MEKKHLDKKIHTKIHQNILDNNVISYTDIFYLLK